MKTRKNLDEYFLTSDLEKLLELKDALKALKNNPNLEKSAVIRTFLEDTIDGRIAKAEQKKNPFQ